MLLLRSQSDTQPKLLQRLRKGRKAAVEETRTTFDEAGHLDAVLGLLDVIAGVSEEHVVLWQLLPARPLFRRLTLEALNRCGCGSRQSTRESKQRY